MVQFRTEVDLGEKTEFYVKSELIASEIKSRDLANEVAFTSQNFVHFSISFNRRTMTSK